MVSIVQPTYSHNALSYGISLWRDRLHPTVSGIPVLQPVRGRQKTKRSLWKPALFSRPQYYRFGKAAKTYYKLSITSFILHALRACSTCRGSPKKYKNCKVVSVRIWALGCQGMSAVRYRKQESFKLRPL